MLGLIVNVIGETYMTIKWAQEPLNGLKKLHFINER